VEVFWVVKMVAARSSETLVSYHIVGDWVGSRAVWTRWRREK